MKGIILCSLFLFVVICCSNGAPVETQPYTKKSARAVGASASKRLNIAPYYNNSSVSTKSYIDTHPHPKKRRHYHKRHHKLHRRRHRHKLVYPLKDRLQYFGGGSSELMPSAKPRHEDFEMTNGEVFEHGGVPDLRSKSVIGGKRSQSLKYGRTEEEVSDIIGAARTHNHANSSHKNNQSKDRTRYQDITKVGTGLHYLFQDNDSGSAGEYDTLADDTAEFEDVANYTNNVGHNARVVINILPREDSDNDELSRNLKPKSKGIDDTFNKTVLNNSSSHGLSNNSTEQNRTVFNNSGSAMKSQGNLIGDEDDTLIENTEVVEIPTDAGKFGKEHNKIVLDKSGFTYNLTNETLAGNSTDNGNVSTATNEKLADNSTQSENVSSLVGETLSKNSSPGGNASLREDGLDSPNNCVYIDDSNTSSYEKHCDDSKAIGAETNSSNNKFVNRGSALRLGNDNTPEKQGFIEEQKMYNDLHKFIERLVSFDKAHRSIDDLNGSQIKNITRSDQQRSISNNHNVSFDKLHNFVENLVFLDKSIYLIEHIGVNSTSSNKDKFPLNESVNQAPTVKSLTYDIKDRTLIDNGNTFDVKSSTASDKKTKMSQRSSKNDTGRFMDIVFSDNSTKSMNSSSGVNIETLNKLHANMDNLVSLCLGFDSEDKKLSNKNSDINSNEMAIRVHTSTGDLVLSCRGLNSAYKQTPSQKTSKSLSNGFGKNDKMTVSKSLSNGFGINDKMADVFLTKRHEKHRHVHELHSKRHQTAHVNYSTSSTNLDDSNNIHTKKDYQEYKKKPASDGYGYREKNKTYFSKETSPHVHGHRSAHYRNGTSKRPLLHKSAVSQISQHPVNKRKARNGTSKRPQFMNSVIPNVTRNPRSKKKVGKLNNKSVKFGDSIKAGKNNTTTDNALLDYSSEDLATNLSSNKIQTKPPNRLKDMVGFLSQFDTHLPKAKICNSIEDTRTFPNCGTEILHQKHLKAGQLTTPRNYSTGNDADIMYVNDDIGSHQLLANANKMQHSSIQTVLPILPNPDSVEDVDKVALDNGVTEFDANRNNINYDDYYNDNNNNGVFNYGGIGEGDEGALKVLPDFNPNVKTPQMGPDYQNDRSEYADVIRDANTPEEDGDRRLLTDHMVGDERDPGVFYDNRNTDGSDEYKDIEKPQANTEPMMMSNRVNDMNHNEIHLYPGPAVHYYKPDNGRLNPDKIPDTSEDEKIIESWY